jgi:hypothetical protein
MIFCYSCYYIAFVASIVGVSAFTADYENNHLKDIGYASQDLKTPVNFIW